MLNSLKIEGFKLFRYLEVPSLSRVNLILGNNNSGKSCLLEAVRLFTTDASLRVIRELVTSRDGDWEANISKREDLGEAVLGSVEDPIRYLFHDFHFHGNSPATITIGTIEEIKSVKLSMGLYRRAESEAGMVHHERVEHLADLPDEDVDEMLEVCVGSRRRSLIRLDRLWTRNSVALRRVMEEVPETPISVVGTTGMQAAEVAFLFDKISLTPQQEQVLDCLRLVEPRIEGIALVGNNSRRDESARTPVIRVAGSRERYPLRTMGDGLSRLFHIALSMVNAQGGVVLIDEFENGIYWEVQDRLWPLIFRMADAFDVQVFATSHSNDCLRSFTAAWRNSPDAGSMYRLERSNSSTRIVELPLINISDALASQVEVR
jgi:hypothetical protein